jgi:hypothetical protein
MPGGSVWPGRAGWQRAICERSGMIVTFLFKLSLRGVWLQRKDGNTFYFLWNFGMEFF